MALTSPLTSQDQKRGDRALQMADDDLIDRVITQVHALVFRSPIDQFKEAGLDILRHMFGCSTALWATGEADSERIYSVAMLDYPLDRLIEYAQHWQAQDFVRAAATRTPGRAIRNEDVMPRADYCKTDIYRRYSAPAGIEHALGIVELDPISRVGEMLFLFRSDAARFYSERDCRQLERLLPHFTSAWRHRQLLHALESSRAGEDDRVEPAVAHAVVDGSGQIHAAEPGFGQLLRDAFPAWSGPLLPAELAATLAGNAPFVDLGRLRVTIRRRDRIVLGISRRDAEPALTAAEWRVAQAYARGRSAPRLAADFGVSPRTVRNQLATLYRKLDVHDRIELIARLRQLGFATD